MPDSSFFEGILQVLPDPVLWATPVYDDRGNIEDFAIEFANKKANEAIGHPLGSLTGLRIKRDGIPSDDVAARNFDHFLKVFETGDSEEFVYYAKYTNMRVETLRRKFRNGVLGSIRDRTALREAERQEQETNHLLKSIVENSPNGILMYEAVRNENGVVVDFINKHYNKRSNELTGYSDTEQEQLSYREILRHYEAENLFELYVAVVETGKTLQHEQYVKRFDKWVMRSVAKLNDGFLAMLTDITELKKLEGALQLQSSFTDSILDASLSGIYCVAAVRNEKAEITDFNYLFVNSVTAQMMGIQAQAAVGESMLRLIPENKTNGFFDLFCRVLKMGSAVREETHFVTAQFNHWFEYVIVKMDSDTLVVTLQDITEKKQAALQIEQQKSMLDNILKYSYSGISVSEMIRNAAGDIVDARTLLANEAAVKYTGIPKELYLAKTAIELDPTIIASPFFDQVKDTLETGRPFNFQYFLQVSGRWLEASVSRMDNDHVITIFTDITQTRNAQLQLEKLVEDLKRSNANLEEFTYAASHDLKEPIRKINTFTLQLRKTLEGRLNPQEIKLFDRVKYSTARMTELVDDLLEYSHVTVNTQHTDEIDLNAKVAKVLDDLELVIQEKEGSIEVANLPVIIANRRQMQQMFQNLIGNALKYSKTGVAPKIMITCKVVAASEIAIQTDQLNDSSYYQINIKDNGIGFEQQYADKIFQVFQRLHGKSEYYGTGVGLAIVKKVVQNHNGFITVESEPGVGSTFKIFLPKDN